MKHLFKNRGVLLVTVLVFAAVAITVTAGLVNWGTSMLHGIQTVSDREQALEIAEAGIDYYRWHLAHAQNDFQDGTGHAGPYVHQYYDKDGNLLGSYALTITAPPVGSTVVKIQSVGTTASTSISRKIQTILAIPSLARYATVANDFMNFGAGTEVFGPIHSNFGIHFDGIAHNIVSSASSTTIDPDTGTNNYAVFTTSGADDPSPPAALPTRSDVFMAGRQFPVPVVDFAALTSNLSQLKTLAQTSGAYISSSGQQGWHIVLKTNDKYDLYKVTALVAAPSGCSGTQTQWGTWSIRTQTLFSSNNNFPANGVIFVEDHLWVDGQINSARLMIAAAKFPDTAGQQPNVTINRDLKYTNYDGQDVIGILAQGNVNVGLVSSTTMRIDGALIAQDGRVGRFFYGTNCGASDYHKDTITLFGMIATDLRYGFQWKTTPINATNDPWDCGGAVGRISSGYCIRNINYDSNLLYAPPPSFPLASSQYQTLSWLEVP